MSDIIYECDKCGVELKKRSDLDEVGLTSFIFNCKYCDTRLDNQDAAKKVYDQYY